MVKVIQPHEDVVKIEFSTGLKVSITDISGKGKPKLAITAVGFGEDLGHDSIYISGGASNTIKMYFGNMNNFV